MTAPSFGKPDRRLKLWVGAGWLAVFALLVTLRGADLWRERERALGLSERRAANLASILAEYLHEAFVATDASLRQLAVYSAHVGGPAADSAAWSAILGSARSGLSGIGSLSVTDAEGTIRHSTIPEIVGQSRRDEYLFRHLGFQPEADLVASTPFRSRSGTMLIPLGRRLHGRDDRFQGMVVATLVPAELREFFKTVDVGARGAISVFHASGSVLFREPSTANPIGRSAAADPVFVAAMQRGGAGVLRGSLEPGRERMLSAFRTRADHSLVVAVSLAESEVLAGWRRELAVSAALLGLLGLVSAAVLVALFRQIDARAAAEEALSRAQRLEALGHMTGGVAHDFNNLLTVILGNASRLRKAATGASAATIQAIRQIEDASNRAATLTGRLLAFARLQPLQPRVVDLNKLVEGLKPMLARLIGEDVSVQSRLAANECLAEVDASQLETALMNLCVNARDAMPRGGVLALETCFATLDERYARLNAEVKPGEYALVSVGDTGIGIPPERLRRVFEPFFTTKEVGKGTGLGLSMVYGFVKQSGGHVKIYSEEGHGTTVKIFLPAAAAGRRPETEAPLQSTIPRGAGEVVLVVEDEDGVRELAVEALSELGYRTLAASDAPTALAMAAALPRVDLLFTDVILPKGMNGRELAEELRRLRPEIRVLYASGYSADIVQHRGRLDPSIRVLAKPYDRDNLAGNVRAALDGDPPPPHR